MIKEKLQSLRAKMSSFKEFAMTQVLEVKKEKNENSQVETNITATEIEFSQGKNLIAVKHFQGKIKILREDTRNKNEITKTLQIIKS